MRHRSDTTSDLHAGATRRLLAISCLAIATVAALSAAGCDDDSFFDSGSDYNARATSRHQAGPRQYWVPLAAPSPKTKSPELLAPADSATDKLPVIADPDALAADNTGLVEKMPDPMPKLDTTDHVAENFKYNKGYREPLLPSTADTDGKALRDLRADSLSLESGGDTTAPVGSRLPGLTAPAGPLGELQRQRALRARRAAAGQLETMPETSSQTDDDAISAALMHPDSAPDAAGPH